MNKTRLIIVIVLFANLLLITSTLVLAAPALTPNYGTAVPDGSEFEWNTTPGLGNPDWVASTCSPAGINCANPTGDLFMRFDTGINPNNPPGGQGDMIILWMARGTNTYTKDGSTCGNGGSGTPCNNWIRLGGSSTNFVEDSTMWLSNPYPPPKGGGDVWRHLADGKGFETTIIEWDCGAMYTVEIQGWVNGVNGQASSTGLVDITPNCTSIDSVHGAVGQAGSITNDTVNIASRLPVNPTGTVTWNYCYNSATTTPPSSTFPNGCMPNVSGYVTTPIGQTTLKLYTAPSPVRVAWNTNREDAIPILLGPILSPPTLFTPVSQLSYLSPNFIPTNAGTYCYYSVYTPSGTAATAGYTTMSHTNNSTECFIVTAPTAVSLSSLTAQAGVPGANLPLLVALWVGALAVVGAGVVGIRKLLRMS